VGFCGDDLGILGPGEERAAFEQPTINTPMAPMSFAPEHGHPA
jgi:hypothetical protein